MNYEILISPFKPYIKRYGFNYVHFITGECLFAKEFQELINELYNENYEIYTNAVELWANTNLNLTK